MIGEHTREHAGPVMSGTLTRRQVALALGAGSLCVLGNGLMAQNEPARRIDTHHHFLPPEYVRQVGRKAIGAPAPGGAAPEWTVADSLRLMGDNAISSAIVSMSAPGVWSGNSTRAKRLARACNEYAAQMVDDHPQRFGFFASLPLPDVRAGIAELEYATSILRCDGIGLMTNYGDRYLGDPAFDPLFADMNQRDLVVYVHPNSCSCDLNVLPQVPASMIEFPHSTTRAIVSLLKAGAFLRYPRLKFLFSHAGGAIPFLVNRIGAIGNLMGDATWIAQLRRLFYDTAGSANPAAMTPLLQLAGARQVLFGSDFPFTPSAGVKATINGLAGLGLSQDDLRAIERGSAQALFQRFSG